MKYIIMITKSRLQIERDRQGEKVGTCINSKNLFNYINNANLSLYVY